MTVLEKHRPENQLRIEDSAPSHIIALVLMSLVLAGSLFLILTLGESQLNHNNSDYFPRPIMRLH